MYKTNIGNDDGLYSRQYVPISVDTDGLQAILGCGRCTAYQIGIEASAKIIVGKRVLWNVAKVQEYLDRVSTK